LIFGRHLPQSTTSEMSNAEAVLQTNITGSREGLDAWVREVVQWHIHPATGCPFWLDYARTLSRDPRQEIHTYDDLSRFGPSQDEWLRGGLVRRWVSKSYFNHSSRCRVSRAAALAAPRASCCPQHGLQECARSRLTSLNRAAKKTEERRI
jgi:hypothetical protein